MTQKTVVWGGTALVCVTAFVAIAILSAQIFEHIPHSEDEVAYLFQARVFAQNRLAVPTPAFEEAFWSPFVLDYRGQRFGKYAIGWPLLLSLGVRLGTPWLINALLGAATLALMAWLANCYYCQISGAPCHTPLWTAGLGLVTPGFLFLSSSLLSHTASLFWCTLALIALLYTTRKQMPFLALLVGICLGLAFLTRPFAALGVGLAIGIFLLVLIVRQELKWTSLLWIMLGGLPFAAMGPLYWWAVTGDPTFNAYLLVWPYDRIGFGPDIGPYGYTLYTAIFINIRLKLETLATGLFGWPGWFNLLFLPIPFLARRASRWDWLLLGTIGGLVFVHIFYWAFGGVDGGFPRYYYDALPAFLLLTVRGIDVFTQFLGQKQKSLRWLPLAIVAVFIGYNFIWNLPLLLVAQKGKYGITPASIERVEQANLPEPALILVKNVENWSDFAAPFSANSPTLDGPVVYAIDWNAEYSRQLRTHFAERQCWQLEEDTLWKCPKIED